VLNIEARRGLDLCNLIQLHIDFANNYIAISGLVNWTRPMHIFACN